MASKIVDRMTEEMNPTETPPDGFRVLEGKGDEVFRLECLSCGREWPVSTDQELASSGCEHWRARIDRPFPVGTIGYALRQYLVAGWKRRQ